MEHVSVNTVDVVNLKINGIACRAPAGATVLEAAHGAGIAIPTLCYLKELNAIGACRICVVEVKGAKNLVPACVYPIADGMEVYTNTERVQAARRTNLKLILSIHNQTCLTCSRSGLCELQRLCREYGVDNQMAFEGEKICYEPDTSAVHMVRDNSKCIMCRRCETMCNTIQTVGALTAVNRGFNAAVSTAFERDMAGSTCSYCGQCVSVCPVNALSGRNTQQPVLDALADPTKIVIAQTAPAVRTALGRDFGYEPGTLVTGKMVSALRQLGFDYVFDTDFAADLTIMEEGTELLHRLGSYLNGDKEVKIPLMTSCCPGWVSFVEQHFPELRDNLSTAKSPQQMFGAIAKSYFAEKLGVDRKDLVVVSIMPCLAKKYEASRPEFSVEGNPDVDYSIYTRELARLIRYANIDFNELPDGEFDRPLGESTGASVIFGTTGGVIEAACRTAYELYTKKNLDKVDFEELRGLEGIRSATIDFNGTPVKIGIAHGLGNARKVIEEVKNGTSPYHAIEVMACPGGCIGGGGQPFHRGRMEVLRRRAAALYREDANKPLRKSHENPYIQQLYSEYLGEPCGPKAHKLLHTHYIDRKEVIGMYIETEKSK